MSNLYKLYENRKLWQYDQNEESMPCGPDQVDQIIASQKEDCKGNESCCKDICDDLCLGYCNGCISPGKCPNQECAQWDKDRRDCFEVG